jgi:hypothetical protein
VQPSSVGLLQPIDYHDTESSISICKNYKSSKQPHYFSYLPFIKGATVLDFPFIVLSMASTLFIHGLDVSELVRNVVKLSFCVCLHFHLLVWTW